MRSIRISLCLCLWAAPTLASPNPVDNAGQMVVVTTAGWDAVKGEMRLYERRKGKWKRHGSVIPVVVGQKGLAWGMGIMADEEGPTKMEGDRRAPAGLFYLSRVLSASKVKTGMRFQKLTPGMTCVDDPKSRAYNRIVDGSGPRDWKSGEDLSALYSLAVVVDHNVDPPLRGMGSCVFIHPWTRPGAGTLGCTALEDAALQALVGWLSSAHNPLLVQLPASLYGSHQPIWGFPRLSP